MIKFYGMIWILNFYINIDHLVPVFGALKKL